MSAVCPHRHVSSTAGRLQTFVRVPLRTKPLDLHRPAIQRVGCSRCHRYSFSSSIIHTQNGQSHGSVQQDTTDERKDSTGLASLLAESSRNESSSSGPNQRYPPLTANRAEALRRARLTSEEVEEATKQKESPPRFRTRRWNPLSESGKQDLQSLAFSLRDIQGNEAEDKGELLTSNAINISDKLPTSPLVEELEANILRRDFKKEISTEPSLFELERNPWAIMLASPIRQCTATAVRLPKDLLEAWSMVKNPSDKKVYFMPAALANTKNLEGRMYKPREQRSETDLDVDTNQEKLDVEERQSPALERRQQASQSGLTPQIYQQPSVTLLHYLTRRFTRLDSEKGTRHSTTNFISPLLPWRIKTQAEKAKFYADRKIRQQSIFPNEPPPEEISSLPTPPFKHVKWDLDIAYTMYRILQERLLITLKCLAEHSHTFKVTLASAHGISSELARMVPQDSWIAEIVQNRAEHRETEAPAFSGAKMALLTERQSVSDLSKEEIVEMSDKATTSVPGHQSRLIPPTLRLDDKSPIPIFALHDLLDQEYLAKYQSLSIDGTEKLGEKLPSPLIIIAAHARGGRNVMREVWRLWRFLGGRPRSETEDRQYVENLE